MERVIVTGGTLSKVNLISVKHSDELMFQSPKIRRTILKTHGYDKQAIKEYLRSVYKKRDFSKLFSAARKNQ